MRLLPTALHGAIDYLYALLLIAAPWMMGFADNRPATLLALAGGGSVLVYSLLTNYELGLSPRIGMRGHLVLDALGGAVLALSPWLFGFSPRVWVPHVAFGLFSVAASLVTRTTPSCSHSRAAIRPSTL